MLYIVSTPIGNLDDLSIRQAESLLGSEFIFAEDTRSASVLLQAARSRFPDIAGKYPGPGPKVISYYKEAEFEKLPSAMEILRTGKTVSLISESGTPLVSDPGYMLVRSAVSENIQVTHIPGSSAVISALVLSGFNPSGKDGGFVFLGFFPKKNGDAVRLVEKARRIKMDFPDMLFVFYESPHRIRETLSLISRSEWDPDVAVCREMTKKFEEVVRGKASELANREFRGEIVVVLK